MKKFLFLPLLAAIAVSFASCAKEDSNAGEKGNRITSVSASSGSTTRIAIDFDQPNPKGGSNVDVLKWADGDQIVFFEILDEAAGSYVSGVKEIFTINSGANTKQADFKLKTGKGLDTEKKYRAFHVKDPSKIYVQTNTFLLYTAIPGTSNAPTYTFATPDDKMVEKYAILSGEVSFKGKNATVEFSNDLMSIFEFNISLAAGKTDFSFNAITITETSGQANNFFSTMEIKGANVYSGYSNNSALIKFNTSVKVSDNVVIRIPVLHRFSTKERPYSFTVTIADESDVDKKFIETKSRVSFDRGQTYIWPLEVFTKTAINRTLSNTNWRMAGSSYYNGSKQNMKLAPSMIVGGNYGWSSWESGSTVPTTEPQWKRDHQWVLIDMQAPQEFNTVYVDRRTDAMDTKAVAIYTLEDDTAIVEIPATAPVGQVGWAWNVVAKGDETIKMQEIADFVSGNDWVESFYINEFGEKIAPNNVEKTNPTMITSRYVLVSVVETYTRKVVGANVRNFKLKYILNE